jgi:hypothetical protein
VGTATREGGDGMRMRKQAKARGGRVVVRACAGGEGDVPATLSESASYERGYCVIVAHYYAGLHVAGSTSCCMQM